MLRSNLIIVGLLIAILSFGATVYAKKTKELLVVRGNGNYPPYEMILNDKLVGIHIDLVYEIASQINLKITFESVPWARAILMLQWGDADAITFIGKNQQREAFVHYFEGNILSFAQHTLFVSKRREKKIQYTGNLQLLKPYSFVTLIGFSYGELFDKANYLDKQKVNHMEQMVQMILKNRGDIGIVNIDELKYSYKGSKILEKITFLHPPIAKTPVYIGFSKEKSHGQLAKIFAQKMNDFKKSKKYLKLLKKYGLN